MTAAIADFHSRPLNATVLDIVLTQTNDVKADWGKPHYCQFTTRFDTDTHLRYNTHMEKQITQEQVNRFLNDLRETGATNMFGATPYIQEIFGVTKYDAQRFLVKWMETFNEKGEE